MKKKAPIIVSTVVCLAAVAVAVPPYWLGIKAEEGFNQRLETIAGKSGLKITRNEFERGWFSSRADTALQIPGLPVELVARHNIYHGPLLFGRWLEGDLNLQPMQALIETQGELKISGKQPAMSASMAFTSRTVVGLEGSIHSRFESPAISRGSAANKLEWRGLQGDIRFDANARHVITELRAPGLTFATTEITNTVFRSDVHEGIAGHYLGKTSFEIANASFASLFQMKKLSAESNTSAQGDMLTMALTYNVADVQMADKQYGPARLAIEIRKLDAAVLARFEAEVRALQTSDRPAEQMGMLQAAKMLQLVGELAKKSPELEITELSFRVGADEVRGKAKLVLDGSKANLVENPMLMLTAVSGDLDVSFPRELIKPMLLPMLKADLEDYRRRGKLSKEEADQLTPQQISLILDRTMPTYLARNDFTRRLAADGDRFRLSATLRHGQIMVNGEPLHLSGAGMLPQIKQ